MKPTREDLILVARARVGCPYIWYGKGRERIITELFVDREGNESRRSRKVNLPHLGFDCSGFGTDAIALLGGRDMRWTHNTDVMFKEWPTIEERELKLFDAVFYGEEGLPQTDTDDDPMHVMWYAGEGMVIGASGGGKRTNQPTPGACVKYAPLWYRRDVIGFRSVRELVSNP